MEYAGGEITEITNDEISNNEANSKAEPRMYIRGFLVFVSLFEIS